MRKFNILMVLAILFTVMMVSAPATAANRETQTIGFSFVSPVITAKSGDTLVLNTTFAGGVPHTLTTNALLCLGYNHLNEPIRIQCNIEQYGTGQAFAALWPSLQNDQGTYDFFCTFHAQLGMVGKLIIDESRI